MAVPSSSVASVASHNPDDATSLRRFPLFACGLRPFFLLAALDALVNMGIWLSVYFHPGLWPSDQTMPAMYWHAHEMLFGFVAAAIAGFLLTAVPNWTGRAPYQGAPLLALTGLWLAGRIAMAPWSIASPLLASAIDLAFYPALALTLAPSLIRARAFHNLPFLGFLSALFLANLCFHLGASGQLGAGEHIGLAVTVDIVVILVVSIGGRIIPAFTKSGLMRNGVIVRIEANKWMELASVVSIASVLIADLVMPLSVLNGAVVLLAAFVQAFRLAQWAGHRTIRDPLLWVLHLGYAWLILGLMLKALWLLTGAVAAEKWMHALTVGAFTTMIIAVMTRASLGHTGRALVAPRHIAVSYSLITIAAAIRVFAPAIFPVWYNEIIAASAALWMGAFSIFLWIYMPILTRPRADGRWG